MELRLDKKAGNRISLLGFGCMRLPLRSEKPDDIDADQGQAMVDYAYAHGVNYYDTAYPYHEGKAEGFIGRALKKYPRESFFLADKMPGWKVRSQDDAKKIFALQLDRCGVEYFDYYLCHAIGQSDTDYTKPYEATGAIDYLDALKAQGAIRRLGFSFHGTPERLERLLARRDWDFVQLQINYLDWDMQQSRTLYEMVTQRDIPCIVMEPVRGGALATLCDESVRLLREADPARSPASWAMRFAASLPNVLTVLSGMSNPEQVRDNVATMTGFTPLTAADQAVIDQAAAAYRATGVIGCTACRYCMDCPSGVDIPEVFGTYNRCATTLGLPVFVDLMHHVNKDSQAFVQAYDALPEAVRAEHCTECGQCVERCPQHIDIPERMRFISGLIKQLRP